MNHELSIVNCESSILGEGDSQLTFERTGELRTVNILNPDVFYFTARFLLAVRMFEKACQKYKSKKIFSFIINFLRFPITNPFHSQINDEKKLEGLMYLVTSHSFHVKDPESVQWRIQDFP